MEDIQSSTFPEEGDYIHSSPNYTDFVLNEDRIEFTYKDLQRARNIVVEEVIYLSRLTEVEIEYDTLKSLYTRLMGQSLTNDSRFEVLLKIFVERYKDKIDITSSDMEAMMFVTRAYDGNRLLNLNVISYILGYYITKGKSIDNAKLEEVFDFLPEISEEEQIDEPDIIRYVHFWLTNKIQNILVKYFHSVEKEVPTKQERRRRLIVSPEDVKLDEISPIITPPPPQSPKLITPPPAPTATLVIPPGDYKINLTPEEEKFYEETLQFPDSIGRRLRLIDIVNDLTTRYITARAEAGRPDWCNNDNQDDVYLRVLKYILTIGTESVYGISKKYCFPIMINNTNESKCSGNAESFVIKFDKYRYQYYLNELVVIDISMVLLRLQICPNLPAAFSLNCFPIQHKDIAYMYTIIISEYAQLGDLFNFVKCNTFDEPVWIAIIFQIIVGLYVLYKFTGVRHKDIHGGNILIKQADIKILRVYIINGQRYFVPSHGLLPILWDYGLSMSGAMESLLNKKQLNHRPDKETDMSLLYKTLAYFESIDQCPKSVVHAVKSFIGKSFNEIFEHQIFSNFKVFNQQILNEHVREYNTDVLLPLTSIPDNVRPFILPEMISGQAK